MQEKQNEKFVEYFIEGINDTIDNQEEFANMVHQLKVHIETSQNLEEKAKLLALAYKVKKILEEVLIKPFAFLANLRKSFAENLSLNSLNSGEEPQIRVKPYTEESTVTISCVTEGYASVENFNTFMEFYRNRYPNNQNIENNCWTLCSKKEMLNLLVNDIIQTDNVTTIPGLKISPVLNTRFYFSKD